MGPGPRGAQGDGGSAGAANTQDLPAHSPPGLQSAVQPEASGTHPLLVKIPLGVTQIASRGSRVTNTRALPHPTETIKPNQHQEFFLCLHLSPRCHPLPRRSLSSRGFYLLRHPSRSDCHEHCPQSKPHGSFLVCAVCPWPCRSLPPPLASAQ